MSLIVISLATIRLIHLSLSLYTSIPPTLYALGFAHERALTLFPLLARHHPSGISSKILLVYAMP